MGGFPPATPPSLATRTRPGHNGVMNTAPAPYGIHKVSYTHDAMIDVMIANPGISNGELAIMFGYSQSWVSLIKSSDAFRERLAARKCEIVDPTLTATVEERFRAATTRSLEVLAEKLSQPSHTISDDLAVKVATLGAKALNIGGAVMPQPQVVNQAHLNELAERLLTLNKGITPGAPHETIEAEFVEVHHHPAGEGTRPVQGESAQQAVRADSSPADPAAL